MPFADEAEPEKDGDDGEGGTPNNLYGKQLSAVAELRVNTMEGKVELVEDVQVDAAFNNNQFQNVENQHLLLAMRLAVLGLIKKIRKGTKTTQKITKISQKKSQKLKNI